MKKHLKLAYILLALGLWVSVLLTAFHDENTTGALDWFVHNISHPSIIVLATMAAYGGWRKCDDIIYNWLNK